MEAKQGARQQRGGVLRKFPRPLAEGVTLNDLVLGSALRHDMPFVLNTACVAVGAQLPLHSHPQHEIWVIMQGHGMLQRGDEELQISEGDVVYFDPDVEHQLTNTASVELELVSVYW